MTCLYLQSTAQEAVKSNPNNPDIKIKISKEYDVKGNITRYDSSYSYSWSGYGQIPANVDSLLNCINHNFFSGNGLDSMLNRMDFGWPFQDDHLFNFDRPFSHFNEQFDNYFRNNPFSIDSSFENNSKNFLQEDLREIQKQQQLRMDKLLNQFNFNIDSVTITPSDTLMKKNKLKGRFIPEKQNYLQKKEATKTISV